MFKTKAPAVGAARADIRKNLMKLTNSISPMQETGNLLMALADQLSPQNVTRALSIAVDNHEPCSWCNGAKGFYIGGDDWNECEVCKGSGARSEEKKPRVLVDSADVLITTNNAGTDSVWVQDDKGLVVIPRADFLKACRPLHDEFDYSQLIEEAVMEGGV